jgi:glycosyltransferase involved in cell wall biosynthesis
VRWSFWITLLLNEKKNNNKLSRSIIWSHGGHIQLKKDLFMIERAKTYTVEPHALQEHERTSITNHSLSVILPAYNEAQVIANTVSTVRQMLDGWKMDFELLIINDGSTDQTGEIVAALAARDPRIRLVTHSVNQGYGAALVSGFTSATKDLTFFMDADGQFDIHVIRTFFLFIDRYDAVIGFRLDRQDSWMRKLNAWGWKQLIGRMLGVHVRDVDCAFKLLHTELLHKHPLETRGAMINAELLYTLTQAGGTYKELAVHHLPRQAGRATGAKLSVILRALRELFVYAHQRRCAEQKRIQQVQGLHL